MRHFLSVALAGTALIVAGPSFAQSPSVDQTIQGFRNLLEGRPAAPQDQDLRDRERHLTDLIEQSSNDDRIDHRQADRAFGELRSIREQQEDMRNRDGGQLSPADHDYIRDRLGSLDRQVDQMRQAGGPPPQRFAEGRDRDEFWRDAPSDLHEREDWLERRIRGGVDDGSLDRREAGRGLDQLRGIRMSEARDLRRGGGGLTEDDRADLDHRLDDLARQIRWRRADLR